MRLIGLAIVLAVSLILAPLAAEVQPPALAAKIFKIGILTTAYSPWHSNTEGFRDGLKEFGYVEGKTDERDGHQVGAHALARNAAGGVGGAEEGGSA